MKFCIGPVSKNIVDAVCSFSNLYDIEIGLIPSRRQVEDTGGYVNHWTTETFIDYVSKRSNKVILQRDHGGPGQGSKMDNGISSLMTDAKGKFDIIHIDPFIMYQDIDKAAEYTKNAIAACLWHYPKCKFEVGTEEGIFPYSVEDFYDFLSILNKNKYLFNQIEYAVIQCGTKIDGFANTNKFDCEKCSTMAQICHQFHIRAKEHNGDFLTQQDFQKRFDNDVDTINIAPEFGILETKELLNLLNPYDKLELVKLLSGSNHWKKWLPPTSDLTERALYSGHYMFSNRKVEEICNQYPGINDTLQNVTFQKLKQLHGV